MEPKQQRNNRKSLPVELSKVARLLTVFHLISERSLFRLKDAVPQEREVIFVGHVRRVPGIVGSCVTLAKNGALEDLWVLHRTFTELVINAAYLHVAEDDEVKRYFYFDGHKIHSQVTKLMKHYPPENSLSSTERLRIDALAERSRSLTGIEDSRPTWSKFNLAARAEETDKYYKTSHFKTLYLTATPYGNAGTHATMSSLAWCLKDWVQPSSEPDEQRLALVGSALHVVGLGLALLCYSMDEKQELGLYASIHQAEMNAVT